jgi:hypothetical protein
MGCTSSASRSLFERRGSSDKHPRKGDESDEWRSGANEVQVTEELMGTRLMNPDAILHVLLRLIQTSQSPRHHRQTSNNNFHEHRGIVRFRDEDEDNKINHTSSYSNHAILSRRSRSTPNHDVGDNKVVDGAPLSSSLRTGAEANTATDIAIAADSHVQHDPRDQHQQQQQSQSPPHTNRRHRFRESLRNRSKLFSVSSSRLDQSNNASSSTFSSSRWIPKRVKSLQMHRSVNTSTDTGHHHWHNRRRANSNQAALAGPDTDWDATRVDVRVGSVVLAEALRRLQQASSGLPLSSADDGVGFSAKQLDARLKQMRARRRHERMVATLADDGTKRTGSERDEAKRTTAATAGGRDGGELAGESSRVYGYSDDEDNKWPSDEGGKGGGGKGVSEAAVLRWEVHEIREVLWSPDLNGVHYPQAFHAPLDVSRPINEVSQRIATTRN